MIQKEQVAEYGNIFWKVGGGGKRGRRLFADDGGGKLSTSSSATWKLVFFYRCDDFKPRVTHMYRRQSVSGILFHETCTAWLRRRYFRLHIFYLQDVHFSLSLLFSLSLSLSLFSFFFFFSSLLVFWCCFCCLPPETEGGWRWKFSKMFHFILPVVDMNIFIDLAWCTDNRR